MHNLILLSHRTIIHIQCNGVAQAGKRFELRLIFSLSHSLKRVSTCQVDNEFESVAEKAAGLKLVSCWSEMRVSWEADRVSLAGLSLVLHLLRLTPAFSHISHCTGWREGETGSGRKYPVKCTTCKFDHFDWQVSVLLILSRK